MSQVSISFQFLVRPARNLYTLFIRTFFHKNVEAEIYPNFKNMLRTYPQDDSRRTSLFSSIKKKQMQNCGLHVTLE